MAKKVKKVLFLLLALAGFTASAQTPYYDEIGWLPQKENHFVYDYYGILNEVQQDTLEFILKAFNDSTSNQIAIVITHGFGGRDIASFAFELGDEWGVGQKDLDNGVVIVVKPKDETDGEVWIATGKGLEGVLPDVFCKRIIDDKMIPKFKEEDYYGAIVDALTIILPVCAGEYSYEDYKKDNDPGMLPLLFVGGSIGLLAWLAHRSKKNGGTGSTGGHYYGGIPSSRSSWSSSSHSSGSSFGGGSFGGGGAGGRW